MWVPEWQQPSHTTIDMKKSEKSNVQFHINQNIFICPYCYLFTDSPFTQELARLASTSFYIQEGLHEQHYLFRQERNTPEHRSWIPSFWRGDEGSGQFTASIRQPETSAVGEWQSWRQVMGCRGALLHCPVGEAEAGIQEHPALVNVWWLQTLNIIKTLMPKMLSDMFELTFESPWCNNFFVSFKCPKFSSEKNTLPVFLVLQRLL